ncbi:hypothetical protein SOPP22_11615 [Shewanella sp. OPT22]|nr:hypothetical protein SOPP22_11615 [Shewanella sp. OPT22]
MSYGSVETSSIPSSVSSYDSGSPLTTETVRGDFNADEVKLSSASLPEIKRYENNVRASNKVDNIKQRATTLENQIEKHITEATESLGEAEKGKLQIPKKTFWSKIGILGVSLISLAGAALATAFTGGIASPFIVIALANVAICAGDAYCAYQSAYNDKEFTCGTDSVANFFAWLDKKYVKDNDDKYDSWMTGASSLIRTLCMCTNPLILGSCYGPSQKFDIGLSSVVNKAKVMNYRAELNCAIKDLKVTPELKARVDLLEEQLKRIEEKDDVLSQERTKAHESRTDFYHERYKKNLQSKLLKSKNT